MARNQRTEAARQLFCLAVPRAAGREDARQRGSEIGLAVLLFHTRRDAAGRRTGGLPRRCDREQDRKVWRLLSQQGNWRGHPAPQFVGKVHVHESKFYGRMDKSR